MAINRLTDRMVRQAKEPGWYFDGAGLQLRVTRNPKTGSLRRSWVLRLTLPGGGRREIGLGSVDRVGLAEVRRKAAAVRMAAVTGEALRPEKIISAGAASTPATSSAPTFKEASKRFLAIHTKSLKNAKNAAQWRTTLETYAWPSLGDVAVDKIDRASVLAIIEPLWGVKTETANRVRARIASVLDWAAEAGFRDPALPNPASKDQFKKSLPAQSKVQKPKHHAALGIDQTPDFMAALRARGGMGALAFEFCILTATRTSETLGARWSEIDLEKAIWTVPAERMKMGQAHRIPLSKRALEILEKVSKLRASPGDYVFPGARTGRPLSSMAFLMVIRKMSRTGFTAHGFRSTFRDWCAERTEVLGEVAEAALAHAVGSKVEAAYRRGDLFDKRRDLMERWAQFCRSGKGPAEEAALLTPYVVQPRRGRPPKIDKTTGNP